ncbi:hypothetical protein [Williamsia sp. D3]|uniref:hypothetical protein n=1 Tax=Williamsia sp. D3 TaxID=1313067 RepID=UPI0003D2DCF6|nr:hypothetical protein [Williamsia sp. D3]ETD30802.1 hypothetical protein W823_22835 [Williamsia sp. D3]PZO61731.1 MAG: hypothetical protein DI635_14605 [Pseudoxanthomonas suwonensis]
MTSTTSAFVPAVIPDELARTFTGILWAAANIAATRPEVVDAIAEAVREIGGVDDDQQLTVESVCVKAAGRRDPCALNPMLPGRRWASWAPGLTERERWECLAEIADRWSDPSDRDTGLRPGRWDEPTC